MTKLCCVLLKSKKYKEYKKKNKAIQKVGKNDRKSKCITAIFCQNFEKRCLTLSHG